MKVLIGGDSYDASDIFSAQFVGRRWCLFHRGGAAVYWCEDEADAKAAVRKVISLRRGFFDNLKEIKISGVKNENH